MRRLRLLFFALVPVILAGTAFLALAHAAPADQEAPPTVPGCQVDLTKVADPDSLLLGDTLQVTMVMSHTCPSYVPPLDLVFLVDISNSMTTGDRRSRIEDPCGVAPDPGKDPFPTRETPPSTPNLETPPTPPNPGGVEPTSAVSNTVPTRPPVLPIDPGGPPGPGDPRATPVTPPPDPQRTPTANLETPPATQDPGGVGPTQPARPPGYDREPIEEPGNMNLIRDAAQFVRDFAKEPAVRAAADSEQLRLGLIAFESRPHTIASLTSKLSRINSAVSRLENLPHGQTNIALGFYRANQIMFRAQDRNRELNRVIVVISDGKFDQRTIRGLRQKDEVIHFAVAMGPQPDRAKLNDLVNEREYLLGPRDYATFYEYYETVMQPPRGVVMSRALVKDDLADNMQYVDASAAPTATFGGGILEWLFEPPAQRITMTYEVEPLEPGIWPISDEAGVEWLDSAGLTGNAAFPVVEVEVIPPTPTPTPLTPEPTFTATNTPDPTATPTPKPKPLYLPITINVWPPAKPTEKPCVPSEAMVDVALIIDTSDSMMADAGGGITKLDSAVSAAEGLVNQLKLDGRDQVTVIGFNRESTVVTPLTTNKALIVAGLQLLPNTQSTGTKMNKGLEAAYAELTGAAHKPGNHSSVVLLTDGRHEGDSNEVVVVADMIKAAGISIITIGLGNDVDQDLLRGIASEPEHFYHSPDASGLEEIYRRIAEYIPCP